jgi:hypothetical protein
MTPNSHAVEVESLEGSMTVARLALGGNSRAARKKVSARLGQDDLAATLREEGKLRVVAFEREARIVPGQSLSVLLRA